MMNSAQREMPMYGETHGLRLFSPEEIAAIPSYHVALAEQFRRAVVKRTDRSMAGLLGISTAKLSKIRNSEGVKTPTHLPGELRPRVFELTGNCLLAQWELFQLHKAVAPLEELRAEVARLRAENDQLRLKGGV